MNANAPPHPSSALALGGALRHRHSPGVQGGYVSNGCPECDALLGRLRVEDLLAEHLARGGALADLAVGITVDLLGEGVWRGVRRLGS